MQITTIGLDIAKNVFQVHGIDATEKVVVRKQLRRGQVMAFFEALAPCLIGMEACATAHYWARELTKLGHEVRLMPAKDVKAYVKRNKNDAADAEAICEAVRRPTMRFVPVKSAEQQARLMQHRARDLLMRQRTQLINALRAHLAELGISGCAGTRRDQGVVGDRRPGWRYALAGRCPCQPDRAGGAASGCADDDRIDREADRCAASLERRKQAASRPSPASGLSGPPRSQRSSRIRRFFDRAVILRPGSGIVPRRRFDRRQTEARADLETGRPLLAAHPGRWSLCRLAAGAPAAGEVSLAHTASRPATVQGCCGRACQQDGADRLGAAGQGRDLSGASTCGSVT